MEPHFVARRPGAANMGGVQYEVGMATLLFLRGYFQTSDFSLNVNVDGAGVFDDVIFQYRQQSGARCKAYMQLMHKTSSKPKDIARGALCAKTGDFSLIRYFESFCEIRQRYGVKDTNQFVIYTNAGLPDLPGVQILEDDSLLSTGGKIICLAETEEQETAFKLLESYKAVLNDIRMHDQYTEKEIEEKMSPFKELRRYGGLLKTLEGNKDRMKNVHDLQQKQDVDELNELWQCFISKLRLFVRQVSVNDLDNLIKETLKNYLGTDKLFLHLKYKMTEWWSKGKYNLSNNYAPFWIYAVQDLIPDLAAPVINRLSPVSDIVFKEKLELSAKISQIVTEGCTELSCLQVPQSIEDVGHFIVDFNTLVSRTDEVLLKWSFLDWCTVLIVEGSLDHSVMSTEKIDNIMYKVCDILQSTKKRIISISNKCEDSFILNLSKKFKIEVYLENFNLNFLDEKPIVRSKGKYNLSNNYAPFWIYAVQDLIPDLTAPVINRLSPVSKIVFKEKLELSAKISQIVTEGCTELSCLQVQQSLKDVGHFIVDFNTLASRTDEVLLKWRFLDWCPVLVVEGSLDHSVSSTKKIDKLMSKVCDILQSTEKRIISISNNCENSFIANLSKKFKIEVHLENFNLNLLDEKSIVRILDCVVDFQGIPVKLGTLADNPSTREAVKANLLLELLSKEGPIKIGECLPNPGPNYVARTVYRKECVRSNIFQDNIYPKLAVSGLSKEQLRRLIGVGDVIEQFNENTNFVDNSSRYFIIKGAEDFNCLCNKLNADIHWIHWSEERFSWRLSTGPLKEIVEHLEDVKVKYDKIQSFVNQPHKVVLILGEPGMGKSEELKYLATKLKVLDESTWVVRVVLNDCSEDLSKDQIDVRELLLTAANITSEIGRKLFNYQLEIEGNIIVLFDGLDEINPKFTEKVNSMIEYLLTKKVKKIWLTSRPIMWGVLEKQFRVLPFLLSPLTKNEQMNILTKLWKCTKANEKDLKACTEKLVNVYDKTLNDSLNLLGIPLHLMLLAEVLKNEVATFSINGELNLPRSLDLLNLYSEFVDIKLNKIELERTVPDLDKLLTQDEVMNSAMVTLFNEDVYHLSNAKEILDMNSKFLGKLDSGKEKIGLVTHVQNGKAVFVHRTFAEYFAAIWFSKNYLSNLDYFRNLYLSGSFETVRMFFDIISAREKKLHTSVLSCNIDEITTFLADNNADIDELDGSGRTALHLAVVNFLTLLFNRQNTTKINIGYANFDNSPVLVGQGPNKNVTHLLQIVEVLLKNGADCSITDNILSWTPVQFARSKGIWCLLDLLLEYSKNPGDLCVIKDDFKDKKFVDDVLEAAAEDECMNLMRIIFDNGACDSKYSCFPYKRTLLHVAAFLGHLELTQFLIDRGADLEARDEFGFTPLMASSVNNNDDVTRMILECQV